MTFILKCLHYKLFPIPPTTVSPGDENLFKAGTVRLIHLCMFIYQISNLVSLLPAAEKSFAQLNQHRLKIRAVTAICYYGKFWNYTKVEISIKDTQDPSPRFNIVNMLIVFFSSISRSFLPPPLPWSI